MGKLNLKETQEERAQRKGRRKRARIHDGGGGDGDGCIAGSGDDADERLRSAVEERLFREKLADALQDDMDEREERLDGLEAHLNDFSHVPRRWRFRTNSDLGRAGTGNPDEMTDEEYAEWIREGMWRRTHRAEMEEQERIKAERKARKEKQRKAKETSARLARQRDAERRVKREFKERRRLREAWGYYETRWKAHTHATGREGDVMRLKFQDVPWPVFSVPRKPEDLTFEAISGFLLHDDGDGEGLRRRTRRERVREAMLRWHPDKFEGRMGARLDAGERETVMEGVGIVARVLNDMMAADADA